MRRTEANNADLRIKRDRWVTWSRERANRAMFERLNATVRRLAGGVTLCAAVLALLAAGRSDSSSGTGRRVWNFETDEPGKLARGFTNEVGRWEVAMDGDNHVLAQKAKNEDAVFNVVLADGTRYKDLDLSVRMRAVAGAVDPGGGLVWRARDKDNYYIARYNPLEDNFRVYKVENGKRTQFQSVKIAGDNLWHTIRITMAGTRITC
jgi:hypothetical protein